MSRAIATPQEPASIWRRALLLCAAALPWVAVLGAWLPGVALASAPPGDVPWYDTLVAIRDSFCGPVARYAITIAIVVSGLLVAFGELQGLFATMLRVIMGASLALMAVRFLGMFGFGSPECGA